jgi:hypothetical protein
MATQAQLVLSLSATLDLLQYHRRVLIETVPANGRRAAVALSRNDPFKDSAHRDVIIDVIKPD